MKQPTSVSFDCSYSLGNIYKKDRKQTSLYWIKWNVTAIASLTVINFGKLAPLWPFHLGQLNLVTNRFARVCK